MATLSSPHTVPQRTVGLARWESDRRRTATDSVSDTRDSLYRRCPREATALQERAQALQSCILRQQCHLQEGTGDQLDVARYQEAANRYDSLATLIIRWP